MSYWFVLALGAPFLWALSNIADQYLIAKYTVKEKERSSGGLVLFSSLIGILIASIIAIFTPDLFSISFLDKALLFIAGILTVIWIILYLYALEIEETSSVVPWFLTVPIFGYFFGYFFLGETLTVSQWLGSGIILFGLIILSIDFTGGNRRIKHKPVIYMLLVCIIIALSGTLFKYVTVEGNFWVSSFWEYLGLGVTGIFLYIGMPQYRTEFLHMNRLGGRTIFLVNVSNELLSITGNLLTNAALLLAPVTLVYIVGSFQPAILLGMTILATRFFPHVIKENLSKKVLIPKIIALGITLLGSIVLFL